MSSLILVATPIGNMGDLSERARTALSNADLVCCEDTRRTGLMLHNLGIDATLMRVDEHAEHDAIPRVLDALREGRTVCLVSDAGTPGISDPGSRLVSAAIDSGFTVSAVPGPAALVMALVISGLPTERFVFEGFLERRGKERHAQIEFVARHPYTVVLYEAPHRLLRTLEDLVSLCGRDRRVAICRELTKLHEEVWRGALGDAVEHFTANEPKGEFVIVLAGAPPSGPASPEIIDTRITELLDDGVRTKDIAKQVADEFDLVVKDVYARVLEIAQNRPE
ncbi:MAG: 16S rRNA (cytidine(1402)-2'-O)-methyltransferase [Actinomycetota bacterium]